MAGEVVVDDHTVVGRALAVIDAVAARGAHVTLAELSAVTGIPKPTVLRIAASLVARQLLMRTERGYALGPELGRLGEKASLQQQFAHYQPVVEELHAAHGGVAWVTAGRDLLEVQPVMQVSDPEFVTVARYGWPPPGSTATLASTAWGHLVLAQRPDLLDRIARRGFAPAPSPNAIRDAGQLCASVHRARRDGFAVESEQNISGWSCVVALLPSTTGTRGLIGVTLPVGRANVRELIRTVLRAFDAITADTGPLNGPVKRTRSEPVV
jgi:DNA-binding IclR family transcriptional regulator